MFSSIAALSIGEATICSSEDDCLQGTRCSVVEFACEWPRTATARVRTNPSESGTAACVCRLARLPPYTSSICSANGDRRRDRRFPRATRCEGRSTSPSCRSACHELPCWSLDDALSPLSPLSAKPSMTRRPTCIGKGRHGDWLMMDTGLVDDEHEHERDQICNTSYIRGGAACPVRSTLDLRSYIAPITVHAHGDRLDAAPTDIVSDM